MKTYDIIVIGSGAGASLALEASYNGFRTALVDRGPVGGTCLNLGCIPSKMLIFTADRIMEIQEARKLGIDADIKHIDFRSIMSHMRETIQNDRDRMREGLRENRRLDFYEETARFTDKHILEISGKKIKGEKIFIAGGARPLIPPINGIEKTGFLTNETVLELTNKPESLLIIGGGYIAVEYGHFFSAMGADVTIIQKGERLVENEEPEVSALLEQKLSERMKIVTGMEVIEAALEKNLVTVRAGPPGADKAHAFSAEKIMIAAGRRPNSDHLDVTRANISTDKNGYIIVDDYFRTSRKNIFAFGDIIGRAMFRHAANFEADLIWENLVHEEKMRFDFLTVPHAVFSHPEIASVGLTEKAAKETYGDVLVGYARYRDTARGQAMRETDGFAKAVVLRESGKILGFHIIGPHASILIQEVVNAMAGVGNIIPVINGIHIHPSLTELVQAAIGNLE